ncbi:MAG: tRNA (adenosine(37)-N6)-dimethylallyltransferase MiaA [Paracoccaceae bacterium]
MEITLKATGNKLTIIDNIDPEKPVLIAGPTASGKSALALSIAERQGGVIVNADALQVWACWRILSARPGQADEARAEHLLYGHLPMDGEYSVGSWLRDVAGIMASGKRMIVTGGTGLFLSALTEGLADIPPTPPAIRAEGEGLLAAGGIAALLRDVDTATAARIDRRNPARVQRAWEVLRSTGRGLAAWQDDTGPPLLPLDRATALVIDADRDWLAERIDRRFDAMIANGALDEVAAILPDWNPSAPWARAIGAPELAAHLRGEMSLAEAVGAAKTASRRYAKRQRTWFRARMAAWRRHVPG